MKKLFSLICVLLFTLTFSLPLLTGCANNNEIKNVIIIIGDGMGLEQIKAGEFYEDETYNFTKWHKTNVNTDSKGAFDKLVLTDSAAGGTAIATGTLTTNGYVGKVPNGNDLETVMDVAKALNKSTAIITTDNLHGATPASFSGHSLSRNNTIEILETQITTSNVDLLCGSTDYYSKEYSALAIENGYTYCNDFNKVDQTINNDKLYWLFDLAGTSAEVELDDVVEKALTFLEKDQDGFVMMIEQAYVDKYCHNNQLLDAAKSVESLNDTVEEVMDWAEHRNDTAVLITADHETGGLTLSNKQKEGFKSWTAEHGKTIYYNFSTVSHSQTPVGLFVYGIKPRFSSFKTYSKKGLIKNIETNQIIRTILTDPTAY